MKKIGLIAIDPDWTYTLGRGENADIRMEHESISKNHAKIAIMSEV